MSALVVQGAPSVAVVICCYTEARWAQLSAAVESLQVQSVAPREVLVVVDHCPQLFERATRELPAALVVENRHEKGLSGARNTGVEYASSDIIAFLDDDASASANWLEGLVRCYSDPNVVGAGGLVTPRWQGRRPSWLPEELAWVVGCSHSGLPKKLGPVRNLIGANMSFRRPILRDLGGFNAHLGRVGDNGAGCEETELCIRATCSVPGARIVYEPRAEVAHNVPSSRCQFSYFVSRCLQEGRSKARVRSLAGSPSALSAETAFLRSTLPKGLVACLKDVAAGHPSAATRAVALLAGVVLTTGSYATARSRSVLASIVPTLPSASALPSIATTLALVVVLALWAGSLGHLHLSRMTDYGLISVLPWTYWLALGLLASSFVLSIRRRACPSTLLAAHVVVFIALIHATPAIAYGTLRYSWAWKHVGIVNYVYRHNSVDFNLHDLLSAYQAWPGFFTLNALALKAAGLGSALSYASWGPPVNDLLWLGPLFLLGRTFTTNRRVLWGGIWIFYLGNWVGQDYFSPQGFVYPIYLCLIYLCIRYLVNPKYKRPTSEQDGRGLNRGVVAALMILPMMTIASTHQLTPFMLISSLLLLTLFAGLRPRWLVVAMSAFTVSWIFFAARGFLDQNLYWIIQSIGHPAANLSGNLISLSQASPDQVRIALLDRILTVGICALGGIGWLLLWRAGRSKSVRPHFLLVAAPIPAIVANSYGGEMVFRVYFFALPFLAFFGAFALFGSRQEAVPEELAGPAWGLRSRRHLASRRQGVGPFRSALFFLIVMSFLGTFLFAYYGKERMNYFPPQEVSAMETLYGEAPPGSLFIGATSNMPWAFTDYELYSYDWYVEDNPTQTKAILAHPARELYWVATHRKGRKSYLLMTTSQEVQINMLGMLPRGAIERINRAVLTSGQWKVVLHDRYFTILTPIGGPHS